MITKDQVEEALNKDFSITLTGSMLGYLLTLLAEEQHRLDIALKGSKGLDIMGIMAAGANNTVGNALLHEVHRACGDAFLAFAMGTDTDVMEKVMASETPDELEKAVKGLKASKNNTNRNLN